MMWLLTWSYNWISSKYCNCMSVFEEIWWKNQNNTLLIFRRQKPSWRSCLVYVGRCDLITCAEIHTLTTKTFWKTMKQTKRFSYGSFKQNYWKKLAMQFNYASRTWKVRFIHKYLILSKVCTFHFIICYTEERRKSR